MSNKYLSLDGLKYAIDNYTVTKGDLADGLAIKADVNTVTDSFNEVKESIATLSKEIELLRSEMDAKTEKPKVKSDLEIFVENGTNIVKDIENWYSNFINLFEVIDWGI